jgi:hypothetical protein
MRLSEMALCSALPPDLAKISPSAYSCFSGEERSNARYSCSESFVRTAADPMPGSVAHRLPDVHVSTRRLRPGSSRPSRARALFAP